MNRKIFWPEFVFGQPVNLYIIHSLTYVEYIQIYKKGKKVYSTVVKDNPLYKLRAEG
jgi:hypothetical protein